MKYAYVYDGSKHELKEFEDQENIDFQFVTLLSEEEYNRFKNADVTKYHLEWDDEHKPVLAEYGKQQWIEMKDGKIVSSAGYRFSETCVRANEDIEQGYDGRLYHKSELPVPPVEYQNEQIRLQRQSRFASEADPLKFDYEEALALGDESTEEKKQLWLAKKKQIREELPYLPNESGEVIEDEE